MSLTFPQLGTLAELASVYDAPTHVYPDGELNSPTIVGMAVVTIVASRAARKSAEQSAIMMTANSQLERSPSPGGD
jgi:hypothetical protein